MTGFKSHLNFFYYFHYFIVCCSSFKLLNTCGVIDSFQNVLTVQCDVRVSCMIILFYFRLGLPALDWPSPSFQRCLIRTLRHDWNV